MNLKFHLSKEEIQPPCIYCKAPSVAWARVPVHVPCPECKMPEHIIADNRPVCLAHHPFPLEVESELKWKQSEKEREEKVEAKRFLMGPIFSTENGDKTIGQIKADAYAKFSKQAVDAALAELSEGNFELY